jgi:hypothetical protein
MHFEGSYDTVGRARTMVGLEAAAGLVCRLSRHGEKLACRGTAGGMPFLFFYNPAILGNARH